MTISDVSISNHNILIPVNEMFEVIILFILVIFQHKSYWI